MSKEYFIVNPHRTVITKKGVVHAGGRFRAIDLPVSEKKQQEHIDRMLETKKIRREDKSASKKEAPKEAPKKTAPKEADKDKKS